MLSRIGPRKKPWNRKPQFEVGVSAAEAGPVAGPATAVVWGDSPSWVVFPTLGLWAGRVGFRSNDRPPRAGRSRPSLLAPEHPQPGRVRHRRLPENRLGQTWCYQSQQSRDRKHDGQRAQENSDTRRCSSGHGRRARRDHPDRGVVWHISDVHHIIPNCCFRQVATVRSQVGTSPISKVVDELCNKVGDPQSIDQLIEMSGTPFSR